QVGDLLGKIAEARSRVQDPALQSTLYQMCTDIERYFQRYSSNKSGDAVTFKNHLESVLSVLNKYLEVQQYPRDFNDPRQVMRQAKESIQNFADFVITTIRRGT